MGKQQRLDKVSEEFIIPLELRAGQNRPNTAKGIQLIDGKPVPDMRKMEWDQRQEYRRSIDGKTAECFVTGKVSHTGREHADLILTGWYVAYPNTATESFTITGDIDLFPNLFQTYNPIRIPRVHAGHVFCICSMQSTDPWTLD